MKWFIVVIVVILLSVGLNLFKRTDDIYIGEPTHTMTEKEMMQVCNEEGIPIDD